jgi:hypothetical protein|tara:strand:+ start:732 stop:1199 length:468 start_codon:yes stop_codon:yes gene_type:complete
MKKWWGENKGFNYYPKCDKVREEINGLEIAFTKKLDDVTTLIKTNEVSRKKTDERIDDFLNKVDSFLFGNGGKGIKTDIALMEQKEQLMEKTLNTLGEKVSSSVVKVNEEMKILKDKVAEVDKQVTINTTKILCYTGAIGTLVGVIATFVPMLFD